MALTLSDTVLPSPSTFHGPRMQPERSSTVEGVATNANTGELIPSSIGMRYPVLAENARSSVGIIRSVLQAAKNHVNYTTLSPQEPSWLRQQTAYQALTEMVKVIHKATGVSIYATAVWDNGTEGARTFDCVSPDVATFTQSSTSDAMRRLFAQYTFRELGPLFARVPNHIFPVIIGLEKFDFRPFLPPQSSNPRQESFTIASYLELLRIWQGLPRVTPSELDADLSEGHFKLVSRSRLPPEIPQIAYPEKWTSQDLLTIGTWLREGQAALYADVPEATKTVFQWRSDLESDECQMWSCSGSAIKWPYAHGAYYAAVASGKASLETPPVITPFQFPQSACDRIYQLAGKDVTIFKLVPLIENYYSLPAPMGVIQEGEPPMLASIPASYTEMLETLVQWEVEPDFFLFSGIRKWNAFDFWTWGDEKRFVDPETGCVCAGPAGVVRYFLALVRFQRNILHSKTLPRTKGHGYFTWDAGAQDMLERVAEILVDGITESTQKLKGSQLPKHLSAYIQDPWQPVQIERIHVNGSTTVEPYKSGSWDDSLANIALPEDFMVKWQAACSYARFAEGLGPSLPETEIAMEVDNQRPHTEKITPTKLPETSDDPKPRSKSAQPALPLEQLIPRPQNVLGMTIPPPRSPILDSDLDDIPESSRIHITPMRPRESSTPADRGRPVIRNTPSLQFESEDPLAEPVQSPAGAKPVISAKRPVMPEVSIPMRNASFSSRSLSHVPEVAPSSKEREQNAPATLSVPRQVAPSTAVDLVTAGSEQAPGAPSDPATASKPTQTGLLGLLEKRRIASPLAEAGPSVRAVSTPALSTTSGSDGRSSRGMVTRKANKRAFNPGDSTAKGPSSKKSRSRSNSKPSGDEGESDLGE